MFLDYDGMIPYELCPYIKSVDCNKIIPIENIPDKYKRKIEEFQKEYDIIFPYHEQHKWVLPKRYTLAERLKGIIYDEISKKITDYTIMTKKHC